MEGDKNIFRTILQLFSILAIFNFIAQRYSTHSIISGEGYLLYNIGQILKESYFSFYFCLHLSIIILITGISVIIARKKVPDLWGFSNKIMWITLLGIMLIHSIGVIF